MTKLISFYLPQFHPIAENDLWWGKGFTEWTNATKAAPLFPSHYQPHLPADLGFYDLRLQQVMRDQIDLAKQYGIDGFCYHYYWFSGVRLLNQPIDNMLADKASDMPFCLCWANENWTRRWDGADSEILIAQKYLPDDDLNFIKSLIPFFRDDRYIRLDGAPFLIVYRPQHLPNPKKTVKRWRDYCKSIGIDRIHICTVLTYDNNDYEQFGMDSGVEFPPHNGDWEFITQSLQFFEKFSGRVADFRSLARSYLERDYGTANVFKTVVPSWDNTPRSKERSFVLLNGTPRNFEHWLDQTIKKTEMENPGQERFVFINAWNEWAEGCHLEPDQKYGRDFLESTLRAKSGQTTLTEFTDFGVPLDDTAVAARTLPNDLLEVTRFHGWRLFHNFRSVIQRYPRLKGWLVRILQATGLRA